MIFRFSLVSGTEYWLWGWNNHFSNPFVSSIHEWAHLKETDRSRPMSPTFHYWQKILHLDTKSFRKFVPCHKLSNRNKLAWGKCFTTCYSSLSLFTQGPRSRTGTRRLHYALITQRQGEYWIYWDYTELCLRVESAVFAPYCVTRALEI